MYMLAQWWMTKHKATLPAKLNFTNINFLNEKITHMWRWDTPQNFLLAFTDKLWKSWKIWFLKKWKKLLEISSFYTCVPKTTIMRYSSWDMDWDRIFCHFEPFFALLFPPHRPPLITTQKTKILKKWKKKHLDMSWL